MFHKTMFLLRYEVTVVHGQPVVDVSREQEERRKIRKISTYSKDDKKYILQDLLKIVHREREMYFLQLTRKRIGSPSGPNSGVRKGIEDA